MIWLGEKRGFLSDWVTQRWVRVAGRRIALHDDQWLDGPVGNTRMIGKDFFASYAETEGLEIVRSGCRGLVEDFSVLMKKRTDLGEVSTAVKDFYERTSAYELDAWSEWHGLFRPFGRVLAVLFSRRLQQLNVPLSSLDVSKGMSSDVIQLRNPRSKKVVQAGWIRELHATKDVLYAGSYSICTVPGHQGPCVKVVFPLPNGNAIVFMKPEVHSDGAFTLTSAGCEFGDPGFYFVVHGENGTAWARYLKSLHETIHAYSDERGAVRAEHSLTLWGKEFLRLHYRMRPLPAS